jgi:hypothetical protein
VIVEGCNLVQRNQLRLFASFQNRLYRRFGSCNLLDLDAVAQCDLDTICGLVEHDTGTIQQTHVFIEMDLLHGFGESRSGSDSNCARALQAIDQTALADIRVAMQHDGSRGARVSHSATGVFDLQ